ncbi:DUF4269 domain-containing protein [Flavobacterium hercynium]|uniref:Diadenosine tetraphosphate hydrolase n=1 Tax=Flavobacterium hercynium TaxID=387094 RepID=A0A226HK10_9FLAO|nr:DUF4269 domain-containing protein [Flavobacterium hercynium]OXA93981.1 diadenosine tetraphosphate hydrolase [Flavobacterium hercynium]SMP36624.1 protein of unknown function [Flavobacterium hercynium]
MIDFTSINYLKNGTKRQIEAFETLTHHRILDILEVYDPILVGTIPIDIAIENSDLDIICYFKNEADFTVKLISTFGNEIDFTWRKVLIDQHESVVATFKKGNFEIEIFGQNIPTKDQNGYKHMLIEYEILQFEGDNFRLKIINLKQKGYKTEPAFALLLDLKGDPYKALLEYKR